MLLVEPKGYQVFVQRQFPVLFVLKLHVLVVLSKLTSCEVGLIHLARVHVHRTATAVRWCACVRDTAECSSVYHLHCNPVEPKLLNWIYLLAHVVDGYLRLSAALLTRHRQMVRLIHSELVSAYNLFIWVLFLI